MFKVENIYAGADFYLATNMLNNVRKIFTIDVLFFNLLDLGNIAALLKFIFKSILVYNWTLTGKKKK